MPYVFFACFDIENMGKKRINKKTVTKKMKRNIVIISVFMLLGFCLVSFRTFWISVVNYEKYRARAVDVQTTETEITPKRGTIYDSNMKVLRQSATVWTIFVSPKESDPSQANIVAENLGRILDVEPSSILEKLSKSESYYQVIRKKVDKPLADEVNAWMDEYKRQQANSETYNPDMPKTIKGVNIIEDTKRYYPYGTLASTVLGFCGNDNQGLSGLESYYDEELTGTKGRMISHVNAWGYDMGTENEVLNEAVDGYGLKLTIDETIQYYLEDALEKAIETNKVVNGACGIIMDVNTGAIYGMASMPDYDPNDPYTLVDTALYNSILNIADEEEQNKALSDARQAQWRNKAVNDLYEPGSVFKTITAASALDSGAASLSSGYRCGGSIAVEDRSFSCAHGAAHGTQNITQVLINSCNVACIQIGQAMGAETFYDYFYSFGLAEKTGIDLPGESRSLYYTDETHTPVTLASSSFGQSNKITPIQMITAIATAVNGGNLVTPHIVSDLLNPDGSVAENLTPQPKRQVISETASKAVCRALQENCSSSGNAMNAYVAGYRVGGKSGTSQKLDGADDEYVASFVGVAPCDDPQVAIIIILDTPTGENGYYGGQTAGPVVGELMGKVLPYLGVERVYTRSEKVTQNLTVSSVKDYTVADATIKLQRQGLTVKTVGTGTKVKSQYPAYGTKIPVGGIVVLYTEGTEETLVTVPDLKGKNANYVNQTMLSAGLNIAEAGAYSGNKGVTVASTSPRAGEKVPMGTVVTVTYMASGAYE